MGMSLHYEGKRVQCCGPNESSTLGFSTLDREGMVGGRC